MRIKIYLSLALCAACLVAKAQLGYPGIAPGNAAAKEVGAIFSLENNVLQIGFKSVDQHLYLSSFTDRQSKQGLAHFNNALFSLQLANGQVVSANNFVLLAPPQISDIDGDAKAVRLADKANGKKITAELRNLSLGIQVKWEACLTDDANYVRQILTLSAHDSVKVKSIVLIDLPSGMGVEQKGTVDGSPLVHDDMFFALEHPMSHIAKTSTHYQVSLPRLQPLRAGEPLTVSSVWGVTPKGQLRRGFLYYVERERAVPYRQQLHYNSWFDISWDDRKLNDSVCLDRIKLYKDSLIDKRGVQLKSFLFDDGWDDNKTLWQFNNGFPRGFTNIKASAASANAGLGVWISPWGGYNVAHDQRIAYGKKQTPPFETNEHGFSLAGPVYFNRFDGVVSDFITKYGVSMFKFDGVGAGNGASGASITYQKDIEALLKLIGNMRSKEPTLYLSLTVGTWPSVYWLKYGDCIWRAGDDTGVEGPGSKRQQWITYKDQQAYQNIVKRAPLYPLNSVMYHGICIASNGLPGTLEMSDGDISDEIWAFFGNGTSLQELYIDPHKLNAANWNCLCDAARWSEKNASALMDAHWIGGDPAKGEVYGYVGWNKGKGVLTLRNPSTTTKTFEVIVRRDFELPVGDTNVYTFFDARHPSAKPVFSGERFTISLKPFETRVMSAQ